MAITEGTNRSRILVAGCGALGGQVALEMSRDCEVFGLRRTAARVPAPVTAIAADLLKPEELKAVVPSDLDAIVYCLTPSNYDREGYEAAFVTGLRNLLNAIDGSPVRRLIFVSSSSVYGQDDDSWIDETSETRPSRYTGEKILEGETLALDSGLPATVVRFSGIYGPSRQRFLESVVNGMLVPTKPAPYTNRIHERDACSTLCHLLRKSLAGHSIADCYLASDCKPARLDEVVDWLCEQVPCTPPKPEARTGGRAGSKRCNNRRLLDSGFEFQYPDYRAGYREMLEQNRTG
ncbi:MAG: NAD-dependent epimerase/dehydratase family protein [Oleiphilaceae bacterium]|nr:NAD-dependent epimerase/dehydratase family protein [Oleiphilaceae bacterium]